MAFTVTINPQPCYASEYHFSASSFKWSCEPGIFIPIERHWRPVPVTFSVVDGTLPPGLTSTTNGLITGAPTTSGNYNFTVQAVDSCAGGAQRVQRAFTMTVNPQPVSSTQYHIAFNTLNRDDQSGIFVPIEHDWRAVADNLQHYLRFITIRIKYKFIRIYQVVCQMRREHRHLQ